MLLILAGLLMLGGCQATPEELAMRDDAVCRNYGAKQGSDIYVQCRVAQEQIRQSQRNAYIASRPRVCRNYSGTVVCS